MVNIRLIMKGMLVGHDLADFLVDEVGEGVGGHGAEVAGALTADGDGVVVDFFFAEDEHEGVFAEFGVADFAADFFGAFVDGAAEVEVFELCEHVVSVVDVFFADGEDDELFWGEPEGEFAAGVFDEDSAEAFHGAEGSAVDHDGAVFLVVAADVFEFEAFGEVVVDLDGAELPTAADGVFDHEVEFGAVEGGFAVFDFGGEIFFFAGFDDGGFGFGPVFVGADVFGFVVGVAEGYLGFEFVEAEGFEYYLDDFHHFDEFIFDLVGATEDVGIVLGEGADAGEAVEFAALFVAIDGAEFGDAKGKVFVGVGLVFEDHAVVGAVHGFEEVLFAFFGGGDGAERVGAVVVPVAGGDVELFATDVRGHDLLVAVAFLDFGEEGLKAKA